MTDAGADSQEALWVLAARGGDSGAFGQLVRLHQRQAAAIAYRFLGNAADAADVAQDAFVRAYRKLEQLDDPSRFRSWLMRIVTNLSLNFRRGRKAAAALTLEEGMDPPATGEGGEVGWSEGSAAAEELKSRIDAAMLKLPESQRTALILFSVQGMPQKDVAEIMGCSIELVKWNVFQARKKLKDMLGDVIGS